MVLTGMEFHSLSILGHRQENGSSENVHVGRIGQAEMYGARSNRQTPIESLCHHKTV